MTTIAISAKNVEFKDKRNRRWEKFIDESYYGMVCVRCIDSPDTFNSEVSFHFTTMSAANEFITLIKESR